MTILFNASTLESGGVYGTLRGHPVSGAVSSPFGIERDVFNSGTKTKHTGVDIAASAGTPVTSPAPGIVLDTFHLTIVSAQGWIANWKRVFGNSVIVQHGDYVCLYAHLSAISVREGQKIGVGDQIGQIGSTGMSTAPHLHWGMARKDNRYLQSGLGLLNALDYVRVPDRKPPRVSKMDIEAWNEFYTNDADPLDTVGGYHRYIVRRRA